MSVSALNEAAQKQLIGTLWERGSLDDNSYEFGKVVGVEGGLGNKPPALTFALDGPAYLGQPRRRTVPIPELRDLGWNMLRIPAGLSNLSYAAPRSCCRCRRMNFGPCISATCTDLQTQH